MARLSSAILMRNGLLPRYFPGIARKIRNPDRITVLPRCGARLLGFMAAPRSGSRWGFELVGAYAAVSHPLVYRRPEKLDAALTREAKLAGALSPILRAGLIVTGRLIAFGPFFQP